MRSRGLLLGVAAALPVLVLGCSQPDHDGPDGRASPAAGQPANVSEVVPYLSAAGVLGSRSEWRRDVTGAPVATDGAAVVANLAAQVAGRAGGTAAFNVNQYNVAVYRVPAGQPTGNVHFDDCQHKGSTPPELSDPALNEPFVGVPIPDAAQAAVGTDGELTVYQPSSDRLWEFWKANRQSDGWHACWGGSIDHVSTSPGYFPGSTGVSASGLVAAPGAVGIREMQDGVITHALSLGVVDAAHSTEFSYPAQRSDGNEPAGMSGVVREGQRLRLDPSLDVDSLGLTPIATAIAKAAQQYGFIVVDLAGVVGVAAESSAGLVAAGDANPWAALMAGVPSYEIMKNFPWDHLQALAVDWGEPVS